MPNYRSYLVMGFPTSMIILHVLVGTVLAEYRRPTIEAAPNTMLMIMDIHIEG